MPEPRPTAGAAGFSPTFASGDRLGKFTIQRFIARGGMGEVYKAWDNDLNRPVAIKTLLAQPGAYAADPQFRHRFRQEARTISHIEHENIVRVLEFGEDSNGLPFIVLPFLEGEDLQKRLARAAGTPLPTEEAVAILLGACRGVDMCHRAGIVHRDLKPGNIFLTQDQETARLVVKVLDFGVAKPRTQDQDDLTADGFVLGTPSYMPPEQARGFSVDARSDQYALGALLYSCLTLRKPYDYVEVGLASRDERRRAVLRALGAGQGFPPPRTYLLEIPLALEATILRAMASDPDDRYPSVFEFSRALLPFASEADRFHYRSYYDAAPRPISAPHMSVAIPSGPGSSIRDLRSGGLAPLVHTIPDRASSNTELPTTKSLRKPSSPPDEATDVSSYDRALPTPPAAGLVVSTDPGTAKLASHIQAALLSASRPGVEGEELTSLAPSQVSATLRDRPRPPSRGALIFAVLGAGILTGALVLHHRIGSIPAGSAHVAPRAEPPSRAPLPGPSPAVHPAELPTAAPPPEWQPPAGPLAPPPAAAVQATTGVRKAPHVAHDQAGHRISVDKHGHRWALDASGKRLFQVDAAGEMIAD